MIRQLKEMKGMDVHVSDEQERIETLNRSLSLTLQTMAINAISLVFVGLVAFCLTLIYGFHVCAFLFGWQFFMDGAITIHTLYLRYLGFSDPITMLNSNFGFFVHCYYSQTYREAFVEVISAAKKKLRNFCCFFCKRVKTNQQVAPDQINAWS